MAKVQDNISGSDKVIDFLETRDRRQRLGQTIDALLNERQEVLIAYGQLIGLDQDSKQFGQVDIQQLRGFCQILVDYIALGHFEIYQRIIEGEERRVVVQQAAKDVYPAIAESTDLLVDFNDKYDDYVSEEDESELFQDLSKVGEVLAIRAELEDKIILSLKQG
ncbi:MAG TPA: Rsd/AlgQ family anti-sigma factor [Gammaproteobacteria bacterium]|nr:Rsd/AlgQ family anti-sigma factor [Gammaproteobacteria bacterium]